MGDLSRRLRKLERSPEHGRDTFFAALDRLDEGDLNVLAGYCERMLSADHGEPVEATQVEVGAWEKLQGICRRVGARRN